MRKIIPVLTLLLIFIFTPYADATTPLGLTQSEVEQLSGKGQPGYMDSTKYAIDYRQFAGGSLDEKHKPTAQFKVKVQTSLGITVQEEVSPKYNDLGVNTPKVTPAMGDKIIIEDLSTPYAGRSINMYDIQHRFVPEGKNRKDYPIQSYNSMNVTSWNKVQQIIEQAVSEVNEPGTLEIYLAISDRGQPYNNLPNWSANGNVAVLDSTKPDKFPKGFIWYFTGMEIEFTDQWWVDVITTESEEIPEDWEIGTHLGTGKVVTDKGLVNLDNKAHELNYYKNGDKVKIDFTFWNPVDDISIAPPLEYAVMYWKHPESWKDMPSDYDKHFLYSGQTTKDIFPIDNTGELEYEYTVNIAEYPFELTTGKKINNLSKDYPPELKAKINPCNEDNLFISLAVVADPETILNERNRKLEAWQQTWVSLNTNIMVVHVPVAAGPDFYPTPEGSDQWQEIYKTNAKTYTGKAGENITIPVNIYNQGEEDITDLACTWWGSGWENPLQHWKDIKIAKGEKQTFQIEVPVPDNAQRLVFRANVDKKTPASEINQDNNIMAVTVQPEGVDIELILPDHYPVISLKPGESHRVSALLQ